MKEKSFLTGFHAIEEILRKTAGNAPSSGPGGGEKPEKILYSRQNPRINRILETAEALGLPREKADEKRLDALCGPGKGGEKTHRGILLICLGAEKAAQQPAHTGGKWSKTSPAARSDIFQEVLNREKAVVLILDGITDPHNLGAVLRSCDKFDVDLVILPRRGSVHNNDTVAKTSAGASSWVALWEVANLSRCVDDLKSAGFWIYGAHMDGQAAWTLEFQNKTALIMGSEGRGLRRLVEESCDHLVSIPAGGHVDSFNVSVAAGILLYEIRRQGSGPKGGRP